MSLQALTKGISIQRYVCLNLYLPSWKEHCCVFNECRVWRIQPLALRHPCVLHESSATVSSHHLSLLSTLLRRTETLTLPKTLPSDSSWDLAWAQESARGCLLGAAGRSVCSVRLPVPILGAVWDIQQESIQNVLSFQLGIDREGGNHTSLKVHIYS